MSENEETLQNIGTTPIWVSSFRESEPNSQSSQSLQDEIQSRPINVQSNSYPTNFSLSGQEKEKNDASSSHCMVSNSSDADKNSVDFAIESVLNQSSIYKVETKLEDEWKDEQELQQTASMKRVQKVEDLSNQTILKEEIVQNTEPLNAEAKQPADERCKVCGMTEEEVQTEAPNFEQDRKLLMSKKKSHLHKGPDSDWVSCDNCKSWYHFTCAGFEQYEYNLYETWSCKQCVPIVGPSKFFKKWAPQRYRWYSKDEADFEEEIGSETWINRLPEWEHKLPAPSDKEVCIVENGHEFEEKIKEAGGYHDWEKIFLVRNPEGLGMKMPEKGFDLEDVVRIMKPEYEVDTIDVFNQNTYSMRLDTFLKKFRDTAPRYLLYNFLSLEFSQNEEMKEAAKPPKFVQEVSIVNKLWPDESSDEYTELIRKDRYLDEENKPKVEQFCLAGMAHSYTDFHVDFGGSSVYYHIFKGQKVFYIAAPSEKNLKAYEEHDTNHSTSEWFGKKIEGEVKRVVINQGETLLIPAGWIHAVYTPKDSLVFGGNFLHLGNVRMQMRVYQLEMAVRKAINSAAKFYFPNFEYLHWKLMENYLLPKIKKIVEEGSNMREIDPNLWTSTIIIAEKLDEWYNREISGAEDQSEKQEAEVGVENKKKVLSQIKKLIASQNSRYGTKGSTGMKKKHKSDDDDYKPGTNKKYAKKARKEIPKAVLPSVVDIDQFASSSSVNNAPLKLKINMGPTEDQQNAIQMFNSQHSSSGRMVKLNQSVAELCGSRLESRSEEIPAKPTASFEEMDNELMRCESIHSGEKPAKIRVPKAKEPKEKKEKPPAKKKEISSRDRLMKKLKIK